MINGRASGTGGRNQKNQIRKALMNPTNRIRLRLTLSALIMAASLFAPAVQALPFVTRTVTPLAGGIFQFDFSILNSGP